MGVGSGFVLQRSRLCYVSAVRDLFLFRATEMTRAILVLLLLVGSLGPLIAGWREAAGFLAPPATGPPLGLSLVAGAIFGAGMVIAGSCGGTSFWRLGEGHLSQVFILLGFALGVWGSVLVKPEILGVASAGTPIWLAVLVAGVPLLGLWWWDRRQPVAGEEISSQKGPTHRQPWSPLTGSLVLAVLLLGTFAVTGQVWRVSRAFRPFDASAPLFVFGLTLGGALGAWLGREWRLRTAGTWKHRVTRFVGGILMGTAAHWGLGCTFGALMGGVAAGAASGWIWLVGALAGSYVGVQVLRRLL